MKGYIALVVLGLGIVALFGVIMAYQDYAVLDFARAKYHAEEACEPCYKAVRKLYQITVVKIQVLSWYFYPLVGLILFLEWAKPVYAKLSVFSVAFCHDFLWFLLDALFMGIVIPIYQMSLTRFNHSYLGFSRVDIIAAWPVWGQILIAVLVADFIRWLHHFLRHKVILFWCFHAVHHSQRDMNPFTDLRVHPLERLIEASVAFIPFPLSLRTDVALASLSGWFLLDPGMPVSIIATSKPISVFFGTSWLRRSPIAFIIREKWNIGTKTLARFSVYGIIFSGRSIEIMRSTQKPAWRLPDPYTRPNWVGVELHERS